MSPTLNDPAQIRIRLATEADVPALAALSRRVFVATFVEDFKIPYPDHDLLPFLDKSHGPQSFLDKLADTDARVWLAEVGGVLAGYAAAGPNTLPHPEGRPEHPELYRLYVDRPFQGAGVGAPLFETMLEHFDPNRDKTVWIGVWSGNIRAQRFYARYGFEKAGEYQYPVGETLDDEFILRRG